MQTKRKCNKCLLEKEIDCFYFSNHKGKIKYQYICKDCSKQKRKEEYWENPEKARLIGRISHAKHYERHKTYENSEKRKKQKKIKRKQRTFHRLWWNLFKHYPNERKKTKITYFDLWKLAKKQKLICALTGRKLNNNNISLDHILPVCKGGLSELNNLRLVCFESNIARNSLSDEDLFKLALDIVNHYSKTNVSPSILA